MGVLVTGGIQAPHSLHDVVNGSQSDSWVRVGLAGMQGEEGNVVVVVVAL